MPRKTPFILVDVFTSRPFGGNQLAVFTDGAALSASEMQELAHEMNFSESTFVMPPDSSGARRVRIFTPTVEVPMAGHPTVGTAWVLASRGEIALKSASVDATLHLGIGPVTVTIESTGGKPDFVWMAHREAEFGAKRTDRRAVRGGARNRCRRISAMICRSRSCRPAFRSFLSRFAVSKRSADAIPTRPRIAALFKAGRGAAASSYICLSQNESGEFSARSRMFAPFNGIAEDPATGSAAAPFGAYAATYGLIKPAPKT